MDADFLSKVTWLRRATARFLLNDPALAASDAGDLAAAVAELGSWELNPEAVVDAVFARERAAAADACAPGQLAA